jgi:deoxyribodipyrimidine photo-lyase
MTNPRYRTSVFLFHRDLRLDDNTGLLSACAQSERVLPVFVLTDAQLVHNSYRSDHAVGFMFESLRDLDHQLRTHDGRLYLFAGDTAKVISSLAASGAIDAVFSNWDYTPFAHARDSALKELCGTLNVAWHQTPDALLFEPEQLLKADHKPYTVYSYFAKKAFNEVHKEPVRAPRPLSHRHWYTAPIAEARDVSMLTALLPTPPPSPAVRGGSHEAASMLAGVSRFAQYRAERNYPALDATSHLSAHHKFGTVSVRQTWHTIAEQLGPTHAMLGELLWRDFFTHVAYHFPHVFGSAFDRRFNELAWSDDEERFAAWCDGRTGVPIVDAGMRQLNVTGYMHNRVRMIVASFLTKDLHLNWQWGERYFARRLIDYDPSVNNGNWQWAASTGCDAQPWFRIFNPWLQGKRWDKDAQYIKHWVPELADLNARHLHALHASPKFRPSVYPAPIVDHTIESAATKKMFADLVRARRRDAVR